MMVDFYMDQEPADDILIFEGDFMCYEFLGQKHLVCRIHVGNMGRIRGGALTVNLIYGPESREGV